MPQNVKRTIKLIAIKLRKQGSSYSDIQKEVYIPKATLSSWLGKIKLTDAQVEKLKERQIRAAKIGSDKKRLRTANAIEEIKKSSIQDISKISKRELWLMGIMLYWRERLLHDNKKDLLKGVNLTSSDPYLIKLFLKWLRDVGQIEDNEIAFDIFIDKEDKEKNEKRAEAIDYWSEMTGFSKESFPRFYFQKATPKSRGVKKRKVLKRAHLGILRIRVKASSMLARQIAGWICGIRKYYWD